MEVRNLADLYGTPMMDWTAIESRLAEQPTQAPGTGGPDRHTYWLTTVNPDGSPHVTAVGAMWVDGALWFETGVNTRKGKNLASDPRCAISIATHEFDVIIEGVAEIVADRATVAAMAKLWSDGGWPVTVDETGSALTADYSAPSAGPPPWSVYRITPRAATALRTVDPGGATHWTF